MKYKKYPSYKDSGVEWLGEIPEHWINSRIKFMGSIFGRIGFRGYTTADIVDEGNGAITLSPSNMKNGNMTYDKVTYLSWEKYYESPEIQIKEGDVVFVKTGSTLGKVGYIDILPLSMTLNPQLVVFKKLKCHSKYLYYLLNTKLIKAYVDNSNNGGTIPTMTQEAILNYEIPSPSYIEQQAIANFLDTATARIDTLIQKQEKLIELLKEKRQAVISHAVTKGLDSDVKMKDSGVKWLGEIPEHWEVKSLRHSIDMIQTGTTPSTTERTYYDGSINWFNPTDLNSQILLDSVKKVTNKAILEGACKMFPTDSVLIVGIGATAGKTSYLDSVDSSFNQQITGFHSKNNYNKYLFYLMKSFTDTMLATANFTTLAILNNDFFKAFTIVMPTYQEQVKIVEYLDTSTTKIDNLITKATKAIDLLKEKRTALISSAVTGKIDVREMV